MQDKTRQDKTRQDKTRQDKTRQDKTRPINRFVRESTGLRSRAKSDLQRQSLSLPDGSTLPPPKNSKSWFTIPMIRVNGTPHDIIGNSISN